MKAITTTFRGPTDTKSARVFARDMDGNRANVPYQYIGNTEDAHRLAAEALCRKMDWYGHLVGGETKTGYVFVFCTHYLEGVRCGIGDP